jgi:general secretion pathway protein D
MSDFVVASMLLSLWLVPPAQAADATQSAPAQGIELMELLELSAERLKKRFIIDPRVSGRALIVNLDPKRMSYADLQTVLSVHGFVATEEMNGTVRILPDANARQLPMPLLDDKRSELGPEEMVTKRIDVGSLQATQLVPILRPLLPQYAHLVAHAETNSLIVSARHANVQMIEKIVRELSSRPSVAEPKQ